MLGKTLGEIGRMPESDLDIWAQYLTEQPHGAWRDDFRAATIAATVASTVSTKPIKYSDYMPLYAIKNKEQKTRGARIDMKEVFGSNVYRKKKSKRQQKAGNES